MRKLLCTLIFGFLAVLPAWATTYYVDTASAGGDGTTQALTGAQAAWATIASVNGATFSGDDFVLFKRGCVWRGTTLTFPSSGTSGHPITISNYGSSTLPLPIIDGAQTITGASWSWTQSGTGTNTWYLRTSGGGNPGLTQPNICWMNDIALEIGTIATLTDHQWAWGNQDTLGYSTVYVRDDTGDPDTTGVLIEAGRAASTITSSAKSFLTFDGLQAEKSGSASSGVIYIVGTGSYVTVQNCLVREAYNVGIHFYSNLTYGKALNNTIRGMRGPSSQYSKGIQFYTGTNNGLISGNTITDFTDETLTAGICIYTANNCIVEKNTVIGPVGNGLYVRTTCSGTILRYNYLEPRFHAVPDGQGQGIQHKEAANNSQIYYNVIRNCSPCILSDGNTVACDGLKLWNNTVIVDDGRYTSGNRINTNTNWEVRNNLVYIVGNTSSPTAFEANAASVGQGTSNYNLYYQTTGNSSAFTTWGGTNYTYANWGGYKTASGQDANSYQQNPGLAVVSRGEIGAGSVAINHGVSVSLTSDFYGRPIMGNPDIGAFEFFQLLPPRLRLALGLGL